MAKLTQIDLDSILRARIPAGAQRMLPRFATRWLEGIVCQDRLNELLREAYPAEGSAFSDSIIRQLDLKLSIEGLENIPLDRPVTFASNHPLGGLDGITLIKILGDLFGDDKVRFLVNDMLMHVGPLRTVFLPVNKYGSQGRESARLINEAYASDARILIFPAGLVSRLGKGGEVADLKWQKAFVVKALEYGRDIVPVRFEALNQMRFYRLARLRKKLGIKVNLEQAMLPAELCASQGKQFKVKFGKPVTCQEMIASGKRPEQIAEDIRKLVYSL